MSAGQKVHISAIIEEVLNEIESLQSTRPFPHLVKNEITCSAIFNVVCVEHRMKIGELPASTRSLYEECAMHPTREWDFAVLRGQLIKI